MDFLNSQSYWHATLPEPHLNFPPLDADTGVDIVILGAGITGLTAAVHLTQAGRNVLILEAGVVGAGTTGGTTGHLEVMPDQGAKTFLQDFGEEAAGRVTQARQAAIDQVEAWDRAFGISCDFERLPAWLYTESADRRDSLREEFDAALRLGLEVSFVDRVELPFATAGGIRIPNQARFHSLRYVQGLAAWLQAHGARICEHSFAQPPEDGEPCRIEVNGRTVTANSVLVCTHSAYLGVSELDMRVAPYQSYVVSARVQDAIPDGLYWDDESPYHYTRRASSADPQLLVIGGKDHKTGQADHEVHHLAQLEQYVQQRFNVMEFQDRWSAELFEPADGLPYIGRAPFWKNVFVATGYSGTGLTFGTMAGKVLADLLLGRENPVAEIVTPSRVKPLAAAQDFVKENMNVAKHYVKDRLTPKNIDSIDELPLGEGRVVRIGGKPRAVYRAPQGQAYVLSPVCTHAGCYVAWNDLEKTWDCPCHGGRYSATGERLYGPPHAGLEEDGGTELEG